MVPTLNFITQFVLRDNFFDRYIRNLVFKINRNGISQFTVQCDTSFHRCNRINFIVSRSPFCWFVGNQVRRPRCVPTQSEICISTGFAWPNRDPNTVRYIFLRYIRRVGRFLLPSSVLDRLQPEVIITVHVTDIFFSFDFPSFLSLCQGTKLWQKKNK